MEGAMSAESERDRGVHRSCAREGDGGAGCARVRTEGLAAGPAETGAFGTAAAPTSSERKAVPAEPVSAATFRSIYTSRDGRLAVFEDARGHLTSVRTARFA